MATRQRVADESEGLIRRLGVVDVFLPVLRARLESLDAEALVDDVVDYLRRHPEVIVVLLASLTVTSGLLVYVIRLIEEERRLAEAPRTVRNTKPRKAAKRRATNQEGVANGFETE